MKTRSVAKNVRLSTYMSVADCSQSYIWIRSWLDVKSMLQQKKMHLAANTFVAGSYVDAADYFFLLCFLRGREAAV